MHWQPPIRRAVDQIAMRIAGRTGIVWICLSLAVACGQNPGPDTKAWEDTSSWSDVADWTETPDADVPDDFDTGSFFGEDSESAPATPATDNAVVRDAVVHDELPAHPWQPPAPSSDPIRLKDAPEESRSFLTNLVLDNLPDDFEDDKKWGLTRNRWDGVKMRMDGLKLRTHRRYKEVNHGTWKRYHATLVDPEEHLLVKITNWKQKSVGTVGFDLNLAAKVHAIGRRQKWNNGVRIYSVTAEAIADLRMTIGMEVSTKLDTTKFPPDVILLPKAKTGDARLVQFKLQRISHADGPVVRELGDALEKLLRKELAERNPKLVAKLNRQIEKKKDDLRFSVNDLVKHKWLGIEPPGDSNSGK